MTQNEKWIWFDLDDTLHDFSGAAEKATAHVMLLLAERSGLPLEIIKQNYRAILKEHSSHSFVDGRMSHEYRAERFSVSIAGHTLCKDGVGQLIELAVNDYERLYMGNLSIKPHASKVLRQLTNQGYSLALLTDAPADAQHRVIEKLGLNEFFQHIFTSGEMGVAKQTGMYKAVLERLSAKAENVRNVGDSLERDVIPALAAHIKPVWFNEKKQPNVYGYDEIESLNQLFNVIN